MEGVIRERAKESYELNVGRPVNKSNLKSDSIKKINTNKELAKIAGVGHEKNLLKISKRKKY